MWPRRKWAKVTDSFFFFLFWSCGVACRILVPPPGIKPMPPAVEAWSSNHWTAREFSKDDRVYIEVEDSDDWENWPDSATWCQWHDQAAP